MRILINHSKEDLPYLPILHYHLKQRRMEALATPSPLSLTEMLMKAKNAKCDAILLCNHETLKNCVPGEAPTLDMFRGSRLNFSVPTVVCNPLSHVHTLDHGTFLLETDLDKLLKVKEQAPAFNFQVLETSLDFNSALETLKACTLIAYDIETKTFLEDPENFQAGETLITCCSWSGYHPTKGIVNYVLPLIDFGEDHFKQDSRYEEAICLLRLINKLDIPKVMHNGMYDTFHSIRYHAEPINWTLDTMALAWSQFSSLPKSLDFVASITLPYYIQWKHEADAASKSKDIQRYWTYNARDTYYTLLICIHYLKHLPAYARKNYAEQFPLVYPFTYCAFEGVLISQSKREELRSRAEAIKDENLRRLRVMFADDKFNPASPVQVKHYIYDVFGATDPRIGKDPKTKKRKERASDEKNLKAIGEQHPLLLKVTDAILQYRENAKAVSTYFDFLQKNSRLLYSVNPFGTDTARAASSQSPLWCGTQIQNIPPYAKEMLVADDGFILVEFDNNKSEARCTAYLSEDTTLIKELEDKEKDFYKKLGTLFFNIPYEEVTKEFRNSVLKKINHGTNYMMGPDTFIENAGTQKLIETSATLGIKILLDGKPKNDKEMTLKQYATYLLEVYHVPFNKVRPWYQQVKNEIATTKMLKSPLGWTRYFFGDINKKHQLLRGAVAHGPQNLSVHILNKGIWKLYELIKKEKGMVRLKAQIHDSAFTQIHESKMHLVPVIQEMLQTPAIVHGRTLLIPVDYKFGKNWADMEEVK